MDPNANLERQHELAKALLENRRGDMPDATELAELVLALLDAQLVVAGLVLRAHLRRRARRGRTESR
jgi:hypothetical protein